MNRAVEKWLGPREGLLWILPAAVTLVFSNGRWQLALVALVAPFFFRLFLLGQPLLRGLAFGLLIYVVAYLIMWVDIIPAPGWLYYAIAATYGLVYFLPFALDRVISPRLTGFKSTLVLPLAWFVTEILVQRLTPYGSWASIGYTQVGNLALMQITTLFGVAGVSFAIMWFNSAAAWLVVSDGQRRNRIRHAVILAIASIMVLAGGMIRVGFHDDPNRFVRVAMLLPSVEISRDLDQLLYASVTTGQGDNSDTGQMHDLVRRLNEDLLERTRKEAEAGAEIIAWSETAGRMFRKDEDHWVDQGRVLAKETGIYLIMGLGTWQRDHHPPLENKVVVIMPDGEIAWQNLKARPIVGTEAHLLAPPHDVVRTLDTPYGRLSVVICHDLDFPDYVRRAGEQGVDLMFGPSADWGVIKTIHARMAVTRALENGFTLVRPTDTGLSVVADPYGRTVAKWDDLVVADRSFAAEVPVYNVGTHYPRIAGFLPWLAGVVLLGLSLLALGKERA